MRNAAKILSNTKLKRYLDAIHLCNQYPKKVLDLYLCRYIFFSSYYIINEVAKLYFKDGE